MYGSWRVSALFETMPDHCVNLLHVFMLPSVSFPFSAKMTTYLKFHPFDSLLTPFPAPLKLFFCTTSSLCTGGISFSAAAIMYSLSICCLSAVKILILWYLLNNKIPAGVCFLLMYTNSISKQATDESVFLFKCLRIMRQTQNLLCNFIYWFCIVDTLLV